MKNAKTKALKKKKDNSPKYHPDFPGGGTEHPFHAHFLKTERGKKWKEGKLGTYD